MVRLTPPPPQYQGGKFYPNTIRANDHQEDALYPSTHSYVYSAIYHIFTHSPFYSFYASFFTISSSCCQSLFLYLIRSFSLALFHTYLSLSLYIYISMYGQGPGSSLGHVSEQKEHSSSQKEVFSKYFFIALAKKLIRKKLCC